ncbi:MAG: HlyD family efflux transporter periplasmic adaptor subunit [Verrucomicrobia bacterium]|nr:HlyD family efflux transporter periplasmic adaptor subunit [Verrucomicrobiota bacterium]
MRTAFRILLVVVIVGGAFAIYRLLFRSNGGSGTVVSTYKVARGRIEQTVQGTGGLESATSAAIASKVAGTYAEPLVTEGQQVEADQLLMRIANDEIDTAVNLKETEVDRLKKQLEDISKPVDERSDVKKAKASLDRAQNDYDTLKRKLDDEVAKGAASSLSPRDLEKLRTDVDFAARDLELATDAYEDTRKSVTDADKREAQEKVTQAEAELKRLREEAAGREVRSPIKGTVLKVLVEPEGLKVDPDKEYPKDTPLFVVADLSSLFVRGWIYQSDAALLDGDRINKPNAPEADRVKARVQLSSQGRVLDGWVTYLSLTPTESASGVRQYEVKITFPAPPQGVTDGLQVSFEIVVERLDDALVLPVKYVELVGPSAFVQKLEGGRPVRTEVRLGISDNNSYQVLDGLNEGDVIRWETVSR